MQFRFFFRCMDLVHRLSLASLHPNSVQCTFSLVCFAYLLKHVFFERNTFRFFFFIRVIYFRLEHVVLLIKFK